MNFVGDLKILYSFTKKFKNTYKFFQYPRYMDNSDFEP